MPSKLGPINRVVAAMLALVWACIALGGFIVAYASGRWVVGLAAVFALGYAGLWVRVVARGRLLKWSEVAVPWRTR